MTTSTATKATHYYSQKDEGSAVYICRGMVHDNEKSIAFYMDYFTKVGFRDSMPETDYNPIKLKDMPVKFSVIQLPYAGNLVKKNEAGEWVKA